MADNRRRRISFCGHNLKEVLCTSRLLEGTVYPRRKVYVGVVLNRLFVYDALEVSSIIEVVLVINVNIFQFICCGCMSETKLLPF
jgi:hypothetical protein